MTYTVVVSANADMSGAAASLFGTASIVQTGAGGAGAAAATFRGALPSGLAGRYVGLTITPSASGTGDASAATAKLEVLF